MEECHGKYSKDGPNQCPHCKKNCMGLVALKSHIKGNHRGGGKCKDCDLVFKNEISLRKHCEKERNLYFTSLVKIFKSFDSELPRMNCSK